jgi:hypothetical protein
VGIRGANRSYYLFDGLGSVVALTNASGSVTNSYTYNCLQYGLAGAAVGTAVPAIGNAVGAVGGCAAGAGINYGTKELLDK